MFFCGEWWFDDDRSDEFVTAPRKGLNESRIATAVANGAPNLRQAICQAAVEVDMRVGSPHALTQFFAGDDLARARQENREHSRGLPLERHRARIFSQLAGVRLELECPEPVNHGASIVRILRGASRCGFGGLNTEMR